MSFQTKKNLCYLFLIFLVLLLFLPWNIKKKEQPAGRMMVKGDFITFHRLADSLLKDNGVTKKNGLVRARELVDSWQEGQVTYEQWELWLTEVKKDFEVLSKESEVELLEKYSKELYVVEEDGIPCFEEVYRILDVKKEISYRSLLLLGDYSNVTDLNSQPLEEGMVFTDDGKWIWEVMGKDEEWGRRFQCLTYQGGIWSVSIEEEQPVLKNVFLVESQEEQMLYFYNNYYIKYENLSGLPEEREQIADIMFVEGNPKQLVIKGHKISGKVVKLSETQVELAKEGTFPLSEDITYYQLNGPLKNIGRNEIPLGYNFTDFIIEEGKIQAGLLVKDEKMESLRVLIKTQEFQDYFHQEIELLSEVDLEVTWGDNKEILPAGETLLITPDSKYFENNRIYLTPKILTGRTYLSKLQRNNKGQGYLGAFEIEKREEGLLLINEVLLEEYLYAVVPSEMPGYYPIEALKAQAISARTYAYQRMKTPGLSSYGANMDDSSTYQVYNNISENANTTRAVRETKGKLLFWKEEPADTYYYSTSCGYGTDVSVWSFEGKKSGDYLKAREMTITAEGDVKNLEQEENFKEFITSASEEHFEKDESWYRWTYSHRNIQRIKENLAERLLQYPTYASFYPKTEGEEFLWENAVIEEIEIKERRPGGSVHCLWFITNQGIVEIKNEYHIRAVLADGEAVVNLQNKNTYACKNLLPSSFFIIIPEKAEESITGIRLLGGGFGHGVGMSQNGAKKLAEQGYSAERILTFYYQGCEVRE